MKNEISDTVLANDQTLQFELVAAAYATKSEAKIDSALVRVATARRMKSNGILDMIASYPEDQ